MPRASYFSSVDFTQIVLHISDRVWAQVTCDACDVASISGTDGTISERSPNNAD